MMGSHHAWCGAFAGALASAALPTDFPGRLGAGLVMTVIAARTAHGRCSPDIDLRGEGVCAHRRLFHWAPFLTAVATAFEAWIYYGWPSGDLLWPGALAVWAGWMAHLWGDFLFGQKTPTTTGPGIPIMSPYGPHHGLGWKVSTRWETGFVTVVVKPATVAAIAALLGVPALDILDRVGSALGHLS